MDLFATFAGLVSLQSGRYAQAASDPCMVHLSFKGRPLMLCSLLSSAAGATMQSQVCLTLHQAMELRAVQAVMLADKHDMYHMFATS